MAYVDLNTIHNPTTGGVPPASWGDQVRDNCEFLVDPPAASVYNSAAVSLTSGTQTAMNADSEFFDNASMHSTSVNTSRITFGTAGRYLLVTTVNFAANATGLRAVRFLVNGTTALQGIKVPAVTDGSETTLVTATRLYTFAATDYAEVQARQLSGGALNATLEEFGATFITR